jgi:hypothetical protein
MKKGIKKLLVNMVLAKKKKTKQKKKNFDQTVL